MPESGAPGSLGPASAPAHVPCLVLSRQRLLLGVTYGQDSILDVLGCTKYVIKINFTAFFFFFFKLLNCGY